MSRADKDRFSLDRLRRALTRIEAMERLDPVPAQTAVNTTEYNLSFEEQTMASGLTVLFRTKDFRELEARLAAQGHYVAPFDWTRGDMPLDRYVDLPPYRDEPHLRLLFDGYEATSIGVIVRKAW